MTKEAQTDDPSVPVRRETFRQYLGRKLAGDQLLTTEQTPGFPWTYPRLNQRPIGTLFAQVIDDLLLEDMYRRYPLARRITDAPVEESFYQGFKFHSSLPDEEERENMTQKAMRLFEVHKFRFMRFAKLVRLYGHSELLFGWTDYDKAFWSLPVKRENKSTFTWTQPIPKPNETELKESDTIPIRIEYLSVSFAAESIDTIHPSRFIHAMNPKLIEEDKQGESSLLPIANLLNVQVHADWSIGQNLWRSAGGLLALGAPKRDVKDTEIAAAIASVENHNAKTVIYVPFGWSIKNIMKGSNIAIARTYRVILEQIAAGTGIPVSILLGSQRGALAPPDSDKETYYRTVGVVQENLLTPSLTKFFRMGQLAGHIPAGGFEIEWNPLEYKSALQKAREGLELAAIESLTEKVKQNMVEPKQMVGLLGKKAGRR